MWWWSAWGQVGGSGEGPHPSSLIHPRCSGGCKGLSSACPHAGIDVETEGEDRSDLSLPGHQLELLQDAVQAGRGSVGLSSTSTWGLAGVLRVRASPEGW